MELTAELTADAQELLVRHDLRAGDAVQLASCSYLHGETAQRISFAAVDERLSTDRRAQGLTLLPRSCSPAQSGRIRHNGNVHFPRRTYMTDTPPGM